MPNFPFQRARATWFSGNRIVSTMMETIDSQQAQAADGLMWSDRAVVQNWTDVDFSGLMTNTRTCCFDETSGLWFIGGDDATDPDCALMFPGGETLSPISLNMPAGAGLIVGSYASAVAPDGTWLLGGLPGSSSANKIRSSTDQGSTWTQRSTAVSDTTGVNVLHTFNGLTIAGFSNGAIQTSPTGTTWTTRTAPNAEARFNAASSGTAIVMSPTGSGTTMVRSVDGITWTAPTLPSTGAWDVAYSSVDAKFLAVRSADIAESTDDGVTWSNSGLTLPTGSPTTITCLGRVWLCKTTTTGNEARNVWASTDGGATWAPVARFSEGTAWTLRAGRQQILAVQRAGGTNAAGHRTLALGGI